jgi:hypothetical protein
VLTSERTFVIARQIAHLKRQYEAAAPMPGLGRPLTMREYIELVRRVLSEHKE